MHFQRSVYVIYHTDFFGPRRKAAYLLEKCIRHQFLSKEPFVIATAERNHQSCL